MKIKNLVLAFLITVSVLFACLYFSLKSQPAPEPAVTAGSVVGPDNYNLISFQGGIVGNESPFISTTTYFCMVQNPTNATSTWSASVGAAVSTTTTTVFGISTSTNANRFAATTTALTSLTVAANTVLATNYIPANANGIVGPTDWVKFAYGSGTTLAAVAQQQIGTCQALFNKI